MRAVISIFDVHDGDPYVERLAVPGTPAVFCIEPGPYGGIHDFWVEHLDAPGVRVKDITDALWAEFEHVIVSAESTHRIGHRIRSRYL